ncbi:uncharacterized protein LDX57_001053 [Aspergillus melleus]|uniref:uncharacterized protein n=1 Tax=Aspergillus melleus TaxID=138277 RepID=UPI001E8D6BF8|nr:uncharacterized protein LDX57_001053 [Aspergillus melleus]KAH8423295.1 hypothetical protein LDX57_001053 [Aspergillus melleus]
MEIFFMTAVTFLVSMYTLFQPLLESYDFPFDIPFQIAGLRHSIADHAMKSFPEKYTLSGATPVSASWPIRETGPTHAFPSQTWPEAGGFFQSLFNRMYRPSPYVLLTSTFWLTILFACFMYAACAALAQWIESNKAMTEQVSRARIQPSGSELERFYDDVMKKSHEYVSGQMNDFKKDWIQVMEDVKQTQGVFREQLAALTPQVHLQTQLQDLETRLALAETTIADKDMEAQVKQLQEQMAVLESQEHLQAQLQNLETRLAEIEITTDKDMEAQVKQLQEQVTALKPQESLQNRTEEFETELAKVKNAAGKDMEDHAKQLLGKFQERANSLESRFNDFDTALTERKITAGKTVDAKLEQLRDRVQGHFSALKQQEEDMKARKEAFDASLKTAEQSWATELKQVHDRFNAQFQNLDLQGRFASELGKVEQTGRELANEFTDKARDGFEKLVGEGRVEAWAYGLLKELIDREIHFLSSGDIRSYVWDKIDRIVMEQVSFQFPDPGPTNLAPSPAAHPQFLAAPPQSPTVEDPKSPDGSSSGPKQSRRSRRRKSKSSAASHPQGSVEVSDLGMASPTAPPSTNKTEKNVPKPQERPHAGPRVSTPAPRTGPASPVTTAPAKGNVGEASKPLERPSPGLQSSRYAPQVGPAYSEAGPSRSMVPDVFKPQGGLAGSIYAAPASNPPPASPTVPQTRDKGKQPMRNETSQVSGTSQGPPQTPTEGVPGRSSAFWADDHKGDVRIFGGQGSKDAPQAPKGPSGPKIEAKGPSTSQAMGIARQSVPRQPSAQAVGIQGSTQAGFSPENLPNLPKLPAQTSRPTHRAGVVEENLTFGKVFATLRSQVQKDRPPVRPDPKTEVGGLAPVKQDPTKATPGPAVPEEASKALSLVDKGKAKEGSGPAGGAAKSESWSDLVEEDLQKSKGSPGASQPTRAPSSTSVPVAAGKEPSRPTPVKESSAQVAPGVAHSRWAPQSGTDAPTPPAAAEKAKDLPPVSPGLSESKRAGPASTKEASKAPPAEKKGVSASRWAS